MTPIVILHLFAQLASESCTNCQHKKCSKKLGWEGMSGPQAIALEHEALMRINNVCKDSPHFPQNVTLNGECITSYSTAPALPYEGLPYATLPLEKMRQLHPQIIKIASCLRQASVRHLDIMCKNMGYNKETNIVTLFDFDIATVDDAPKSTNINERLTKTHGVSCRGHVRTIDYTRHVVWYIQKCLGMLFGEPADRGFAQYCR